ncbi:TIGR00180 family glycosyltransferase [Amylibacter sp.]|nr:TIGR00180 family glycosyltransferase [Amylibacter sp.]
MNKNLLLYLKENISRKKRKYSHLSKLTVIIPSYCRQDFIIRQSAYWHGTGVSVIIMDGSPKPIDDDMKKVINGLFDITYVHSASILVDRLKHASTLIKTPYSVLCGDDEFLLSSGINNSIDFLENNQDYVACIGQSLHFYLSNYGSKCKYGTGYDTFKYEVKHDSIQCRLNASVRNYNAATCYAITKSPVWCRSWGNLLKCSSGYINELEHAFTTYIWGNVASVDDVYWMRSNENLPAETIDAQRLPIETWWASDEFKTERMNFFTKLADESVRAQGIDRANAEDLVVKAFELLLQEQKYPSNSSFSQKCRQYYINTLKKYLPKNWIGHLIKLRNRLKPKAVNGNFGDLIDLKATRNPLPFLLNDELVNDLFSMEKLIADFYKVRRDHFE